MAGAGKNLALSSVIQTLDDKITVLYKTFVVHTIRSFGFALPEHSDICDNDRHFAKVVLVVIS